jgi:hypothetical protein
VTFEYDPTTSRGKVRLLCSDTVTPGHVFEDEEVDAFLALCEDEALPAAAMALRSMAAHEVLVQKRIRLLDLQTDGPAEAKELRALADKLDETYEAAGGFDWAEMVTDSATFMEQAWNEGL